MNKPLYERDVFAWTQAQAEALSRRSLNEIDWDNLIEEVLSLGRAQRSELTSRLSVLLCHLMKWTVQANHRSRSWALTILEQRRQIARNLRDNPSLKTYIDAIMIDASEAAIFTAVRETGLRMADFETLPQITFDEALSGPVAEFERWEDLG